jgi:hypothetical protein
MVLVQVFRSFVKTVSNNSNHIESQIGRWCIPNSPKYLTKATLIMDRSNEDHCGVCGDNILFNKVIALEKPKLNVMEDEENIYYYPYTM